MILTIKIRNPALESGSQEMWLVLVSSESTHGMVVFNLTGLGSPKATVSGLSGPTYDGITGEFVRADARHILLTLAITARGDEEEIARQKIYDYFPVKEEIRFTVLTDTKEVETWAIVESVEMNQFAKVENAVISLYCPDPYFMGVDELFYWARYHDEGPAVVYAGDQVPASGIIRVRFPKPCGDFLTINNTNGNQIMSLDFAPIGGAGAIGHGETIVVDSQVGQKSITHYEYDGTPTDLLSCFDPTSDWINFRRGDNVLSLTTDTLEPADADRPDPVNLVAGIPLNEWDPEDPILEWEDNKIFTKVGTVVHQSGKIYDKSPAFQKERTAYIIGPAVDAELNPTAGFSINIWVRPRSVSAEDRIVFSAVDTGTPINGYELRHTDENKMQAVVIVDGTEWNATLSAAVVPDVWAMYTLEHQVSPGPYIRLTKDASVSNTDECPAAIDSYAARLSIGGLSTGKYFDGRIQMLSLHDMEFSAAEKTWLYRSGYGRTFAEISGSFTIDCNYYPRYQGV